MVPDLDPAAYVVIFVALALGGIVKGVTGAGAPVVAVPVMAAFFDVRLAVMLMVVPNLITNTWQVLRYWRHRLGSGFTLRFSLSGAAGAVAGTIMLSSMPARVLTLGVAAAVIVYVGLRIFRPEYRLSREAAHRQAVSVGLVAGVLQGAAGISAPASVSFLNAMRIERLEFVATIAAFFLSMAITQFAALVWFGLMTGDLILASAIALVPLAAAMPAGAWLARRISTTGFDRLILVLLSVLAVRLLYAGLS